MMSGRLCYALGQLLQSGLMGILLAVAIAKLLSISGTVTDFRYMMF